MLVSLFIFLFHNAEAELVRMVTLKFGQRLPLSSCPQSWIFDNKPLLSPDVDLTQAKVGFYNCGEKDKFFALAFDDPFKFELRNDFRKYNMVGENIEVNCSIKAVPGTRFNGYAYTRVTDSSNKEIVRSYAECFWVSCSLIAYKNFPLVKPGQETYFCTFNYKVLAGQAIVDHIEVQNRSIYAYMAPTNVKPDLKVKELNVPINCTSDGNPSPTEFMWSCEGSGWQSEGHQLTIQNYGEYFCICTVNNTVEGTVYGGSWNGTISIIAGAEREYLNGITFVAVAIIQIVEHLK